MEVGVTGQGGLAGSVPGPGHLLRCPNTPVCSLATPSGEESLIVYGYLKITYNASQPDMSRRQKH